MIIADQSDIDGVFLSFQACCYVLLNNHGEDKGFTN